MTISYRIQDLRDASTHRPVIADRIWRAWWEPDGRPLSAVDDALAEILATQDFPFTLVASENGEFLGTVTAVMDDIPSRPELGPCLAALWVEPSARGQGVGEALMTALRSRLGGLDFNQVYLSARPHMREFYSARGWTLIETGVSKDTLDVFRSALP